MSRTTHPEKHVPGGFSGAIKAQVFHRFDAAQRSDMNDNFVVDFSSKFEKGRVESDGGGKIEGIVGRDFGRIPEVGG